MLGLALIVAAFLQIGSPYSIAGEVRDANGKLASHVLIYAEEMVRHTRGQRSLSRSTVTDAKGRFQIKLDGAARYRLIYRDEEHGHMPQFVPFFRDPNNPPLEVVLTPETPTALVNISMSKNGALTGEAIDGQTELPIDHVEFRLCYADNHSLCWSTGKKSADGKFSVPTPYAPFTLRVTSADYEDWYGLSGDDPNTPISIAAATTTPLKLVMKRKAEATNRALNEAEKHEGINLPAPKPISPDDNQVFDIYPRLTRLEWAPVDGAGWYRVEIDVCQGGKRIPQCIDPQPMFSPAHTFSNQTKGTSYEFIFVGAQPGRWRVWAVDKDGRDGFKSVWRTFLYLK